MNAALVRNSPRVILCKALPIALLVSLASPGLTHPAAAQQAPAQAAEAQRTISYTAPDGRIVMLLARADTDGDGIENELEIDGYAFDVQSGELQTCQGGLDMCYFTDPLQASTDQDPYSDFMEATGANMDQSVEAPFSHPLVAAEPVIVVRLLSTDVVPIEAITDTQGNSQSTEFSTSYTTESESGSSLAVTTTAGGEVSFTEGFSVGGEVSVTEETFHSRTQALTTGTSEGVEINWSTARTIDPSEAAHLALHVVFENQGNAPAFDIVPSFNVMLGGKVIATITPDVPPDLTLTPGDVSAELVIEQDDQGNAITLTLEELKAVQLGAPLTLEVIVESATVAWWNPQTNAATDRIPWSTFRPGIEAVTTVLQGHVGEEPHLFKVYAGNQDGTIRHTLREQLSLVFDVEAQDGTTTISNRPYPDDWYMTSTSDDLIAAWEDAGRPDILDLLMVRGTRLHMLSPGTDPGPALEFASFGPDMEHVFVIASPRSGFPIVSVQVTLTLAGEAREVALVKETGSAFYTNAEPFEAPPESVGVVTVTDARGDVTTEEVAFPFAALATDCGEVSPRPPANGEYLLFLADRPAPVYCWFYEWSDHSVLDPPLTSFWIPRVDSAGLLLRSVHFLNADRGFVAALDRLLQTEDGGRTWNILDIEGVQNAQDVFFVDDQIGTIVGNFGTILRTEDGGETWTAQESGLGDEALVSVYFTAADHGVAVGFQGTIVRTTNGGATWTSLASDTEATLNEIVFSDVETGFIAGGSGSILRTDDGGATWLELDSGTDVHLNGIFFTDSETGFVVGDDGTILHTGDGGQSWTPQAAGTTNNLSGVSFADSSVGMAVGGDETILRTTDGGQSWSAQEAGFLSDGSSVSIDFGDVHLTDVNSGIVTGLSFGDDITGVLVQTTSGGGDPVVITAVEDDGFAGHPTRPRVDLAQNYPNPFSAATTIRYTVPAQQHVRLAVFDLLGRQIAVLADDRQAAGTYSVRFGAAGLARGLYFYRLEGAGTSEVRTMVVR